MKYLGFSPTSISTGLYPQGKIMWVKSRFICKDCYEESKTSFLSSFLKENLKLLYQEKVNILDAQIQSLR